MRSPLARVVGRDRRREDLFRRLCRERIKEQATEIRYLRSLFYEHVGTDPENVQPQVDWEDAQREDED